MSPPSDLAQSMTDTTYAGAPGRAPAPGRPVGSFWRKLAAAAGPGYLVAVGYMDPGNWATGLAGGSAFGYRLLIVVVIANLMAMVLQSLAARLGIATGLDLAQACRAQYGRAVRLPLWLLCEVAIVACDLAEVLGSAIALQLLFHLPLVLGIVLTSLDVLVILALQRRSLRKLEALVLGLILLIAACFAAELVMARPSLVAVLGGLTPSPEILRNPAMLYVAIGILGATVMPHNLYLHSSVVQSRPYEKTLSGKREAVRFATLDSTVALTFALLINAAILILAATTFHTSGHQAEVGIEEAYKLLSPALGVGAASLLFGVALLASGQNATITGTLAGQIVLEGFTDFRIPPWARRLLSRFLAVVPAAVMAMLYGADGVGKLLIASQVILSLQLPFAVIPLILLTSDKQRMGDLVNSRTQRVVYWGIAAVLVAANGALLTMLILPQAATPG
jgi:manganese transport protein